MSPALRKILRILGFLAYAAVAALLFVVTAYASFSLFVRSGATRVPEVEGLGREEARGVLADSGLRLEVREDTARYDPRVAAGRVLDQSPSARSLVKRGSQVDAVLSLGPQQLEVPDLTGKSLQSAQVTAAAAGVTVGRTLQVYAADATAGTVVVQEPAAGRLLPPEGTVDLLLARGGSGREYVMPDLVYRHYDPVRDFFQRAGMRLGRVTFEVYEGAEPGTILRQFPLAGHPLSRRDAISLVVAASPEALARSGA